MAQDGIGYIQEGDVGYITEELIKTSDNQTLQDFNKEISDADDASKREKVINKYKNIIDKFRNLFDKPEKKKWWKFGQGGRKSKTGKKSRKYKKQRKSKKQRKTRRR